MQIILIAIYIMFEIMEFYNTRNANNVYLYIDNFVQNYYKSKILFLFNNLSFFYILFLIFVLKIDGFGIIIAGIFKFFDIATKLWFINKKDILENMESVLKNFTLSFFLKALNHLSYILLVSIGFIL